MADATGASSCRVSQGGWEGRDTIEDLGTESCQTRTLEELKCHASPPSDAEFRRMAKAQNRSWSPDLSPS
jgi:hypothetical protein